MHRLIILAALFLIAEADQCDPYTVHELLHRNRDEPLTRFANEARLIDEARAVNDRATCARVWGEVLAQVNQGRVVNGKVRIYHGKSVLFDNWETHMLLYPKDIYSHRTTDWLLGLKEGHASLDMTIISWEDGVDVKIVDESTSAPVVYVFHILLTD